MIATAQPIAWIVRVFDSAAAEARGEYRGVCTVTMDVDHVASVQGLVMPGFDGPAWDAVSGELRRLGARRLLYLRKTGGRVRCVSRAIPQ